MSGSKTYHHRIAGARFVLPNGEEFSFDGGSFTTSRVDVQAELDKVANVPSSMIFTTIEPPISIEEKMVTSDLITAATIAFDSDKRITGPAQTIPVPVNPDPKPTLSSLQTSIEKIAAAKAAIAKN